MVAHCAKVAHQISTNALGNKTCVSDESVRTCGDVEGVNASRTDGQPRLWKDLHCIDEARPHLLS